MIEVMRKTILSLLLSAFFLWSAGQMLGQEEGIEESLLFQEEVVTPAKIPLRLFESPTAVTVLTEEDIRMSSATNLPDLLRMVVGTEVMILNAAQSQLGLRGLNPFASTKLLILIDGQRPFLDFYGVTDWNLIPVSLEDVKRIEIVKTPGTIYGANALSGVIHILTKNPEDVEGGWTALQAGEHRTYRASLRWAGRTPHLSHYFFLSGFRTGGWPPEENRLFDKDLKWSGKVGIRLRPSEEMSFQFSGSDRKGKTFLPLAVSTFDSDVQLLNAGIHYKHTPRPLRMTEAFLTFNRSESIIPSTQQTAKNRVAVDRIGLQAHQYFSVGERNLFSWGVEAEHLRSDTGPNTPDPTHPLGFSERSPLLQETSRWNFGGYMQFKYSDSRGGNFYVGGRLDHHFSAGPRFSPFLSYVKEISPATSLRISNFTMFRAPNLFEQYSDFMVLDNGVLLEFQGTPTIAYERMNATEMGLEFSPDTHTRGELNLFYNQLHRRIDRIFVRNPNSSVDKLIFVNGGSTRLAGVELSLHRTLSPSWSGILNATYQEEVGGATLTNFPKTKAGIELSYSPPRGAGFSAHLQGLYVGRTRWEVGRFTSQLQPVNDYFLVNAALRYTLWRDLQLRLSAFNLLNHPHEEFVTSRPDRKIVVELSSPW